MRPEGFSLMFNHSNGQKVKYNTAFTFGNQKLEDPYLEAKVVELEVIMR